MRQDDDEVDVVFISMSRKPCFSLVKLHFVLFFSLFSEQKERSGTMIED
jgi:hypothetical protein